MAADWEERQKARDDAYLRDIEDAIRHRSEMERIEKERTEHCRGADRANEEVREALLAQCRRQNDALERIATALEQKGS